MEKVMEIIAKLWGYLYEYLRTVMPTEVLDLLGQVPMPIADDE